jgi:hypothetical protein
VVFGGVHGFGYHVLRSGLLLEEFIRQPQVNKFSETLHNQKLVVAL